MTEQPHAPGGRPIRLPSPARGGRTTSTPEGVASVSPDGQPASLEALLPPLLTTKQAADLCGCGERTLWRWSRSGISPPPVHIGGAVRYSRDALLEWIAAGCPRVDGRAGQ